MRHFDKFKYFTISKSNISSCQKASTLTFMSFCGPLFCLNNIENIFGHSHFFGSSVTYKQHIKHVSFNFTCHTILAILGHSGRQTEIIKTFYILRRHQRFTLKKELSPKYRLQNRDVSVLRLQFYRFASQNKLIAIVGYDTFIIVSFNCLLHN